MDADEFSSRRAELWRVLDARRDSQPMDFRTVTEAVSAAAIPLDWRTAIVVGELLGHRGELGLPRHVVEFVAEYAELRRSSRLLDPFVVSPSLLAAAAERPFVDAAIGFVANSEVHAFAERMVPELIEWQLGQPRDLIAQSEGTFDLVLAAPPINLRIRGVRGDATLGLLVEAAKKLERDGEMIVLLAESFNSSAEGRRTQEQFAALGVSVQCVVAVSEGGLATRIPLQLTVLGRGEPSSKVFVARLSSQTDSGRLARAVIDRSEGATAESGQWIDHREYTTWEQLGAQQQLSRLLAKTSYSAQRLADVADEIRAVELRAEEDFEIRADALYLPEIRGKATLTPTSEGAKRRRYIEVTLDPRRAHAEYLAAWLDTSTGRLARDSMVVGTTIPRVSARTLGDMPIVLPPIDKQVEALRVDAELRSLALQTTELRERLWRSPDDVMVVRQGLEALSAREEDADAWLESLPFPLASIAYRYIADASIDDKIGRLLNLFEAMAEFAATLLLSAVRSNPSLYEAERERLRRAGPTGTSPLERSTFGSWIQVGRTLSKTLRGLLGDAKTRDSTHQLFGVRDERMALRLTSDDLWKVLDGARAIRNERAHGGIQGHADKNRVLERLEGLLFDLREALGPAFAQVELVQPGEMIFSQGVFRHTVRRLTGPNSILRRRDLEAVIALDRDFLYVVDTEGLATSGLQVLPFFRLMAPPNSEQTAIYFYSSRERTGELRFVSYHFEGHPEEPVSDAGLSALLDELS